MISEFQFISNLKKKYSQNKSFIRGIGDDCAIIPFSKDKSYLISSDLLVENIHFKLNQLSFEQIAYKAIAVNISDISAMGGVPRYIFVSLSIPKKITFNDIKNLYNGLDSILKKYHLLLLGGDTSSSNKDFTISVTIVGISQSEKILYRNGAKIKDYIYITGYLGDSAAGLYLLSKFKNINKNIIDYQYLINKHIKPAVRFAEIRYLIRNYKITSAIDISDGLLGDLNHILESSQVGAFIKWDAIKFSSPFQKLISEKKKFNLALNGGEDYEILLTSSEKINKKKFEQFFKTQLNCIGYIKKNNNISLKKDNKIKILTANSFNHFN